jgi:hypothetical protein
MWPNRSICSYSDFNLAYVAEFQCKAGYAKKPVGMETLNTHFLLTPQYIYVSPHFGGETYCFCPVRLSVTQFVSATHLKLLNRIS